MKEKLLSALKNVKQFIRDNKYIAMKVVAGIIIVITLCVVASGLRKPEVFNYSGNSSNLGLAVQQEKWIYYVEIDADEPVGICRVKNNGKKTEKVVEGYMYYLNIVDNYIYCLEHDEDSKQNNLIKVRTNGKHKEILARDIDDAQVLANEKWVYYHKNDNLYRVKLNGTDREKVSSKKISYFHIDGNWIYYIYENNEGNDYIARMELDGDDAQRIAKADVEEHYQQLFVKGNKVYYITAKYNEEDFETEFYLYKMNKKGEKVNKICNLGTDIIDINMHEDRIYYIIQEDVDEHTLESIKYNGTGEKTISIRKTKTMLNTNLTEDWVIYLGENEDSDIVIKMISKDTKKEKDL